MVFNKEVFSTLSALSALSLRTKSPCWIICWLTAAASPIAGTVSSWGDFSAALPLAAFAFYTNIKILFSFYPATTLMLPASSQR